MTTNLINALNLNSNNYNITLPYGVCANEANVNAMTVTVDNPTLSLEEGARVAVKFTNTPTLQQGKTPTLNVNGLGAATIKAHGETLNSGYYWAPGEIVEFLYADEAWNMLDASPEYTFSASNPTLQWGKTATIGGVGGAGNATFQVTMPANPNTDQSVTDVAHHYTPTTNSASQLSADASSSAAAAAWGTTAMVTGVNIQRDAKGHVTGVTVDSIKMPANPDHNTSHAHSAGVGLIGSGNAGTSEGTYDYKVALVDEVKHGNSATKASSNQLYAVQLDKDGKLSVAVPWTAGSDVNVTQTVTTSNANYPVLLAPSGQTATATTGANFGTGMQYNPSTNNLSVKTVTLGNDPTTSLQAATKQYVDSKVAGATQYLGTVASADALAALNPGKGDFVRVSTAFGGYHASDMLICETPKNGSTAATWSVIHGEIDSNTWVANTKSAAGYVAAGGSNAYKVWKTDGSGNPAWRDDSNTVYYADSDSILLDGTTFKVNPEYIVETGDAGHSGLMSAAMLDKLNSAYTTANNYKGTVTDVKIGTTSLVSGGVATIPSASTSVSGVVQLSDSVNETSTSLAATANAVRQAYNLANSYKGTITGVTAGNGLTGGGTSGAATLNVGAGTGIKVTTDAVGIDPEFVVSSEQDGMMTTLYYNYLINHKHTVSYTPAGTVSTPTFTATNSFEAMTAASASTSVNANASVVSAVKEVSGGKLSSACANKCLTISVSAISASTVSVAKGDHVHTASTSITPTKKTYTPTGTVSKPTFAGTAATITTGKGDGIQ